MAFERSDRGGDANRGVAACRCAKGMKTAISVPRATRPDAASIARLVPRAFSLPQREAPPLWETPRAAHQGEGGTALLRSITRTSSESRRGGEFEGSPSPPAPRFRVGHSLGMQ